MHEYRAKIGFITPARDNGGTDEYATVLPHGVAMRVATCAVQTLVPEDFEKAFSGYPAAAEHLAGQGCDAIMASGSLVFSYMGFERATDMVHSIKEKIGIPIITNLEAHFDALKVLGAKKIVIATPYEPPRTEERRKLCESVGFEVINTASLGLRRREEIQALSPYVSYRLARQAYFEAPEADAIYISCPEWPTAENVGCLEDDTGKPVVYPVGAEVWALMKLLQIRGPVQGYGKLLEMM